jgi:catechol 2,3-dioxygenase-like lactoylglutathione lyase family enzyme
MGRYVDPTEQLVTEIVVRDIGRSTEFYCLLGFELLRDGGDFVELTWEDHRLFLAELSAFHEDSVWSYLRLHRFLWLTSE